VAERVNLYGCEQDGDIVASARVHLATRLLASTDTPLALVGLLAGYSDQPHFQRAFRTAVGPTPAEYRRLATRREEFRSSA
jgi:AraC family transcriptional regulator